MVIVFLILTITFAVLFYFKDIFIAIVFGLILIALINQISGIYNQLLSDFTRGQRRAIAVAITLTTVLLILAALLVQAINVASFASELLDMDIDFQMITNDSSHIADSLFAGNSGNESSILHNILGQIINSGTGIVNYVKSTLSGLTSILVAIVLIVPLLIGLYYSSKEESLMKLNTLVPAGYRRPFWETFSSVMTGMERYLFLKVFEAFVLSIIYSVGFWSIGLPYAIPLGILMGLFSLIPYIGFIIAAVPVLLISYTAGTFELIGAIVTILIAQVIDLFVLMPSLMAKEIKIEPLTAIILTLVAWQIFGAIGLVLGIPVYLVYKIVLISCYNQLVEIFDKKDNTKSNEKTES